MSCKPWKSFDKKFNKFINSDNFNWYDYSAITNFLLLYLKRASKMYKEHGCTTTAVKHALEMDKARKMLKYAINYEDNCTYRCVDGIYLITKIREGQIFRPGKNGKERVADFLKQQRQAYIMAFNYIGRHIMGWWD